jgi:hypothetical protein
MARRRTDSGSRPSPEPDGRSPSEIDWESPRWREADGQQGDDERARRLRGSLVPDQSGAIDDAHSIDAEAGSREAPGTSQ